MSRVRVLRPDDLPPLADLWLRSFHKPASPEGVRRYFHEVFIDHPVRREGIESLVYEDDAGRVSGFIGALPRRMVFRGRPIRAAVATQLMVEPGRRRGFAAFELLRSLFAGPQELTFSDGANEPSQRVWERSGGEVAKLYSLDWKRLLRPAGYLAYKLGQRGGGGLASAARPLGRVLDRAAAEVPESPFVVPEAELEEEDLREESVRALLAESSPTLYPAYDEPSLVWLLQQAERTRGHGTLRSRLCRDRAGDAVGWYVYYLKPGGVSQVLQFGGKSRSIRRVLHNLIADAHAEGSVAMAGQVEPRWMRELSDEHAVFTCRSLGVLVHARDRELLGAVQRGESFLSRLDGEWWLRFGRDPLVE